MIYKHYPQYKDSGVEWIGAVPEGWGFGRIKLAIAESKNGVWGEEPDGINDIPCVRVADFDRASLRVTETIPTLRSVSGNERSGRVLQLGDLLLEKSGGGEKQPVGQVVLYMGTSPAVCSNFVARLKIADGHAAAFWNYVFAAGYSIGLNCRSIKQTSGIQNLDQEQYLNEQVAIPQYLEQVAIAATIDLECARIGALITKKTQFIELLREKRQALITHAVTKGLDPKAPMKDSGVEWIGEVPAHWKVSRMANAYCEANRCADPSLPVLSVSIHYGITNEELAPEERDRRVSLSEDRTTYKRVAVNDLVYNMMRAWQGAFGAVEVEGLVSPAYVVAEPIIALDSRFVELLLRTAAAIEEMRRYSRGVADFRMRLYWEYFRDVKIPLPSPEEQAEILAMVDEHTFRIDALIAKTERSIELLRERRSAFITAAVTGRIDLRQEVAAGETQAA